MTLQIDLRVVAPIGPSNRMIMNLRSSAPNTPNKPRAVSVTPTATPTRKAPHCRKCKRPRAGHPRSGCPYVEDNNPAPTREATPEHDNITHALNSLRITTPPENDGANKENIESRPQPVARRPLATRLSLSTTAGEVFERLRRHDENQNQLPLHDISRRQSRIASIEEWQHSVAMAMASESDTDGSGNCSGPLIVEDASDIFSSNVYPRRSSRGESRNGASLSSRSKASARRPLVRSMSMEEREAFVRSLNDASDATVYVLPKADINDVHATAVKLGFRTRIVMNEKDTEDLQALLVLARDQETFEWLSQKIEKEDREATAMKHSRHTLSFMAGGAVIGAVGAWASLAFS